MILSHLRTRLVSWAAAGLLATAALAQAANYTRVEATAGKPAQLGYYGSANKNCAPAPLPTIRVIEAPKSGILTVRRAILTTNKIAGCPALKTPVQVVLYQARAGNAGPDHVAYEVTSANGEVATYDVTINIKEAPKPSAPGVENPI